MKADRNDAPDYITKHPRKSRRLAKLIPGLIGTVITLAVLQMAGSAFLQGTAQSIAEKRIQSKPVPLAEITRVAPVPTKDWDRVVEDVAARGDMAQPSTEKAQAPSSKQTVFSDANYIARGADNVLTLRKPPQLNEQLAPVIKKEITVVGQKPSMKDRACWPHKEGSLERRRCRSNIGLNYRD